MKTTVTIMLGLVLVLGSMMLTGCPPVASREEINSGLSAATTQAAAATKALDDEIARLRATTQPTATQPDFVPTSTQIAEEAKLEKPLVVAKVNLEKVMAVSKPLVESMNDGDIGKGMMGAAPATGPAAPYVYLAGLVVSSGIAMWKWYDDYKTRAAAQANIAAIQAAVAAGTISVKPEAANAVGANTPVHTLADQLVQVLTVPPTPKA